MNVKKSLFSAIPACALALTCLSACTGENSSYITTSPLGSTDAPEQGDEPGASAAGSKVLVADFESGADESAFGDKWYAYADGNSGGESTIEISVDSEGSSSKHALTAKYTLVKADNPYDPYVGFGVNIPEGTVDFSKMAGFHYCYKGNGHTIRMETSDISDSDVHGYSASSSTEWKCKAVAFKSLAQEGWGAEKSFEKEHIVKVSVQVKKTADNESGSVSIDNIMFLDEDALAAMK